MFVLNSELVENGRETTAPDKVRSSIDRLNLTLSEQNDWIRTTKLSPPLIRSDTVERPHLLGRLERDVRRPLTLITAAAGYGKSTIAAQWLEASSLPGVWISLDEADNNPRAFLGYIVAAIRRLESRACARIHDLLDAAQLPPSDILATLLANDLEEINEPFLLVLDDSHLVTDQGVHDVLDRLLRHPPHSLHLVILTRRDPPLPLVTMKARGQAVEIREADLQFDSMETGQVLERVGDIHLDEHGLARVMNEIEGWITGLRLFCLAVDGGEDPTAYLSRMSGGASQVQDYLVEQVLSRQPVEIQECLLKTSILDRFCAPLCEVICNDVAGQGHKTAPVSGLKFMDTIINAKLFGIQFEPGSEWIRYHHLFQFLLLGHLQRKSDPQYVATLHRRAAQWFGDNGLTVEGIKHAENAGDFELVARLIEDARLEAMSADKWQHLGKWLDSLPPGVENSRPHLLMFRAWVTLQSLCIAEIPAILDTLVALEGESPDDPMLAGELEFYRGVVLFFAGEVQASKQHLDAALRLLPETNLVCRCECDYFSHIALHMSGNQELAINGLRTAIQRNEPRSPLYRTRLVFGLYFAHSLAGHWPEALRAAAFLEAFSRPHGFTYAVAWAIYLQGHACLQMGDMEGADRFYRTVFEQRYIQGQRGAIDAFAGHALCLQLEGREAAADECLKEALEFAHWTGDPTKTDIVDACRARVALLRGNVDAVARWLAAFHGKPEGPVKFFFLEYPEITVCRALVARGTPVCVDQAATLLEPLEAELRRFHNDCQLVPVLVIKSLLYSKTGRGQDALDVLAEAVGLAWPGRWVLPFIEGGAPVAKLLRQLPDNPEWGGFVPYVLDRFVPVLNQEVAQQSEHGAEKVMVADLTNRETDVLVLVSERLYDKEIADRLSISTSTVKTHLRNIYGKLEVANRREAAREARRRGLV